MIFSHTICAIEAYRVSHGRPGAFGDEIIIEGWFLTHAVVREMSVVYPGQTSFVVNDRRRASEGVWRHHGDSFGEAAKTCRFQLIEPTAGLDVDLQSAFLRVEMESGETIQLPIGPQLDVTQKRTFSKDDHDLVMQFESMGDNCEFGLVQRKIGSERLSLLRYAGVGDIEALAAAIANGFVDMSEPGAIGLTSHGNEWIAHVHSARLVFHTGRSVDQISHEKIIQEETRKLVFMAQKFIDDCEAATKTFVYRVHKDERGGPDGTRGMERIYDAMTTHGPVALLWVNVADEANPDGTIRHVRDRLYRGYIDHLAPAWNAFDFRPESWLNLLRNARIAITGPALPSP
jgi:hypothetical protein